MRDVIPLASLLSDDVTRLPMLARRRSDERPYARIHQFYCTVTRAVRRGP